MTSMIPRGNVNKLVVVRATLSPAQVAVNTTAQQTFTVPGVQVGDVVVNVEKPTHQAGLFIGGARVTAANTVGLTFGNCTSGAITPTASEAYDFVIARPDSTSAVFQ